MALVRLNKKPVFCYEQGFTLVELIMVMVILGLVSSIGASFLVQTLDAYKVSEVQGKLIQRGRLALEQMSRQLHMATPNSLRVSSSGNCLEFMPVVAGSYYQTVLPDVENQRAEVSSVATSPFSLGLGTAAHVVVAPFSPSELYTSAKPSARVGIGSLGAGPYSTVPFSANHQFLRNSNQRRLYLSANPKRFCLIGTSLLSYENYGFSTSALNDANPGGDSNVIANGVATSGTAFALSPGSEDRNALILINLQFSDRGRSIDLNHQVLIKNVP